jgi:purine-nucleoside phosphorylase
VIDMRLLDDAFGSLPKEFRTARPRCGLVLGSGWSRAVEGLTVLAECPYAAIPGLGQTAVVGHAGRLVLAHLRATPAWTVLAFCGRRHWYEGVGWEPVILPADFCRRLGVRNLLITNAAGGIRLNLAPGDIVLLRDHLRMSHLNPLLGPHNPAFGARFPDQSQVYHPVLMELLRRAALDIGYNLTDGVYAFSGGPSYETPAEIRAYGFLGADVVGMSTVPEAMVASASGMRVAALSLVSNMAAGISGPHLSHDEVLQVARNSEPMLAGLLHAFLARLGAADDQGL